jgi:outer membrane lipase/esterase
MRAFGSPGLAGGKLLVLLAALALAAPAARADFVQIVAFGDSLTDAGNVATATGGQFPPAPYSNGRFSNGPVWAQQLAARLGVPALTPSLQGGSDYAFGFAETGNGTTATRVPGLSVPNVGAQIQAYLGSHTPSPNQVFVIWAGANDFFDGQTNPAVPIHNLVTDLTNLAKAGATHFLVPDLPPLGDTPFGRSLPAAERQGLNALTLGFNAGLDAALNRADAALGVTTYRLDAYGILKGAQADPARFGFTDVTDAALDKGNFSGQGYLFWDSVHPTAAGHQLLADQAAAALAPEPSSLALVLAGAAGLLGWGCRRRAGGRASARALAPPRPVAGL